MTERVRRVAERIRQELAAIERVVRRAGRAMAAARRRPDEQDLYLDSAALCLHDFYTGMERIFQQIAAGLDEAVPSGRDWHEALLQQMAAERLPDRPAVIAEATREALEEYLRFRHVVRNIYAFEFDPERVGRLVERLEDGFGHARRDLLAFADFLERVASGDGAA
jgi:hypothetical protein